MLPECTNVKYNASPAVRVCVSLCACLRLFSCCAAASTVHMCLLALQVFDLEANWTPTTLLHTHRAREDENTFKEEERRRLTRRNKRRKKKHFSRQNCDAQKDTPSPLKWPFIAGEGYRVGRPLSLCGNTVCNSSRIILLFAKWRQGFTLYHQSIATFPGER